MREEVKTAMIYSLPLREGYFCGKEKKAGCRV
jgi:hypothetical protein